MFQPLTIGLLWHTFGHGNLGVDALARSNTTILRDAARDAGRNVRFLTLASSPGPGAVLPSDVTLGPLPRLKPLLAGRSDFLRALRQCNIVVDIGEGDSWTDIYGLSRFGFQIGTKLAALALRKPLVLAPQTIGPFDHPIRRRIADGVMNRARAVFTRDTLSTAYVHRQRIRSEVAEFIDVAFRLPFTPRPRTEGKVRVGLNVSGLLYRGGYSGKNELGLRLDYVAFTHRLIAALRERPAVEIHLVPHVIAQDGNDDDRAVVPELLQLAPDLIVPPPFAGASDAKTYMSGLDFVIGGRMHACIGAFSARVPVVPIAYSRKFNGLFDTLGYRHYVDGKAVDSNAALAATMAAFDRRDVLAADIEPGLALAADRLAAYQARLTVILRELP